MKEWFSNTPSLSLTRSLLKRQSTYTIVVTEGGGGVTKNCERDCDLLFTKRVIDLGLRIPKQHNQPYEPPPLTETSQPKLHNIN